MSQLATRPTSNGQIVRPSALNAMATRLNVDPDKLFSTLKNTAFKGASDQEMLALVVVANQYGLNPFLKQIYAFPAKGGGIVPVVGIDGWTTIVNSKPEFDGVEFEYEDANGKPHSVTCIMHVRGRAHPVKVTEYYDECFRATEPWKTMPRRMLRHKAFIQCARVAFSLGGIHEEDEAQSFIDTTVVVSTEQPKLEARPKALAEKLRATTSEPMQEPNVDDNGELLDQGDQEVIDIPTPPTEPEIIQNWPAFLLKLEGWCAANSITERAMHAALNHWTAVELGMKGKEGQIPAEKLTAKYADLLAGNWIK